MKSPPSDLTSYGDDRDRPADQFGRQRRQAIVLLLRPTIFDRDIASLDVAGFAQAMEERAQPAGVPLRGRAAEKPDHRYGGLLRARSDRPRCCRPA